jgi:chromosome segregation ATPase
VRLKRYLVYRAHRALGIGPLFERTAHNEQHIVRAEEAFVRAQRRFESQAELAERATHGVELAALREESARNSRAIATLNEREQETLQGGEARLAGVEAAVNEVREGNLRASRAIAAVNERTQEQLLQSQETLRSTESRLAGIELAASEARDVNLRASRAIASLDERMGENERQLSLAAAGLESAGRAGDETRRQVGVLRSTIGLQGDRIASTEDMIGEAGNQIGQLRQALAELRDEFAARTEDMIGEAGNQIGQLSQAVTELREEFAAQAARRHNEDARLTQVEAVQVEVLSGLRPIQERWPGALDELAQMGARLAGFADQLSQMQAAMGEVSPPHASQEPEAVAQRFQGELSAFSTQLSAFNAKLELVRRFVFSGEQSFGAARVRLSDLDRGGEAKAGQSRSNSSSARPKRDKTSAT